MKNLKSHFKFNKQERSGIFFLLLIVVVLQVGYFIYTSFSKDENDTLTFDSETQAQIDALKLRALEKDSIKIYPFNPNFITDYKGYTLGMSPEEIDRLHAFRKQDKFANSPEDFQKVTQISDSLLRAISPYFKFPKWTQKGSKQYSVSSKRYKSDGKSSTPSVGLGEVFSNGDVSSKDLNTATAEDLKSISGIGDKLSARIIKFRDRLGGFLVDDQLYDVYGLEPVVVRRTLAEFRVIDAPKVEKINVTWASYNELRNVLYINDKFAKSIIEHRNHNTIRSLSDLKKLEGFPEGKYESLKLYLSL